jgi:hypothetical protein
MTTMEAVVFKGKDRIAEEVRQVAMAVRRSEHTGPGAHSLVAPQWPSTGVPGTCHERSIRR